MADALEALARRCGILASYTDQLGRRRRTGRPTQTALLRAMGLDPDQAADHLAAAEAKAAGRRVPDYAVCDDGIPPELTDGMAWELSLEDGTLQEGRGVLPTLPLGLHRLRVDGQDCTLISGPRTLPLPARAWGLMLPLHALRSPDEGGLTTYADLARTGISLAGQGVGFVGLNPIHAGFWGDAAAFSPYTPSHRRRLNTFFVAPDPDTPSPAPADPLIDFGAEIPRRRTALRTAFDTFTGTDGFERFSAAGGLSLHRFALHQALSERHGPYWRDWPIALQDPASSRVRAAARELTAEITFHTWLQWRAEAGLVEAGAAMRNAGMETGLYLDLAVGTHPYGAETWEDRTSFAFGASLGAPPDAFSAAGQSWGLAPFNPRALIANGFAPLAETLRRQFQFAGALRIDHILGFDRAFWVPEGGGTGAYVQMPRDAMLAVLRLEAARARGIVVGEDLGNVPRGLRPALARAGILGCQLQLFERAGQGTTFKAMSIYPKRSIASFSTHDLPTWRGWRAALEIRTHHELGHIGADQAKAAEDTRTQEVAGFDAMAAPYRPNDTPADAVDAMHAALAAAPSVLALVQIENLLDIAAQPNLPGTTTQYPNWRQRLPVSIGALGDHPGLVRTARLMQAEGR